MSRPSNPAMDANVGIVYPVLDHGFVRVVDYMGDDAAVVQAARVSYGAGTDTVRTDRGLIRYMMRHRHSSPFEMCELKLHVKLPIFVARQWIRHRTANVNEISARYSILDSEFYLPEPADIAVQSSTNRQGRGEAVTPEQADSVREELGLDAARVYATYEWMLNDDGAGGLIDPDMPQVARELARMNLTLNYYTQWYWKIDLHNLLHFLALRSDPHAQLEIRRYAEVISRLVAQWVPWTWEAFEDYRLGAVTLSRMEVEAVRALVDGRAPDWSGMTARERREFAARFGLEVSDG